MSAQTKAGVDVLSLWDDVINADQVDGAAQEWIDRLREARAAVDEALATLRWYADPANYFAAPGAGNPVRDDMGNRARHTLARCGGA